MRGILDRLVLLLYCLGAVLLYYADTAFLTAFLSALIYTSLDYYFQRKKYHFLLDICYMAPAFFCPEFLLFYPLVLYGLMENHYRLGTALAGALCLVKFYPDSIVTLIFIIAGSMIALLLQYHSSSYEKLYQEFKKMRDESVEKNLLLKEKNQALLEKQNYEIYAATLRERNRIAREIHDNVGHMLSRSILLTGAMKAVNKDSSLTALLAQTEDTLNTAMTNIRESVHDLHDESVNLKEALEDLTNNFSFCPVEMEYDMGYQIPRSVKYSFITIVKEGLNNVIKHSNASKVRIISREHPGLYQLIIEDNGTNIRQTESPGLGLLNIRDRVDSLGGALQIQTKYRFRIFITIPKKEGLT